MDPVRASNSGMISTEAVLHGDPERIAAARKPPTAFTITIVGKSQVGKSALAAQFLYQVFLKDYVATVLGHLRKKIQFDGETVVLEIWDTSGAEITYDHLYKKSDGFLCIFSLKDEESLAAVEHYWREIREARGTPWTPFILLGNKKDSKRQLASLHNRASKLAAELSVPYYKTSVKEPALVEQVFHELMRLIIQFRNGVSRDVARQNSTVSTMKPGKEIKGENSLKISSCAIRPCSLL